MVQVDPFNLADSYYFEILKIYDDDSRHLKKKSKNHFGNSSTNRHKIWNSQACWPIYSADR